MIIDISRNQAASSEEIRTRTKHKLEDVGELTGLLTNWPVQNRVMAISK
jgi:hypothetical protein